MSYFECLPVELVTRIISLLPQPALLASLKRFSRIHSLVVGDVRESQLFEVASMVATRTGLARELQQLAVQTPLLSTLSN